MALVCETVTADSMTDLLAARDAAQAADLVELRLDGVRDLNVAGALAGRRRPVVVTCRPSWEGGRFDGAEDERLRILGDALALGAEFVDVEWRADRRRFAPADHARLVLSHHDFHGVPADLADRVRAMRAEGAGHIKVAVMATALADCLSLRAAMRGSGPYVAIAMGAAGRLTRVWPAWAGSVWMYAGAAAPGQVSTQDLIGTYRVRETTAATAAYGIVGAPLGHSASPAMHNAAFATLGVDAVYVPLETASADEFLSVSEALGLRGASVTAPVKQLLAAQCVTTDEVTASIGAVNTLKRSAAGWEGRNYDVAGFLAPLDRLEVGRPGAEAMILGAGGAARAAAWALGRRGLRVSIAARRPDAAAATAAATGTAAVSWSCADADGAGPDLLVNTTPVGAWPKADASPVASPRGRVVYDLVYNPTDTLFLQLGRANGARTIGGLEMLVEQAARQFEWWMEQPVPRPLLDEAARRFLGTLGS